MAITLNGTDMSQVYLNGTRMSVVNINGTEAYRAANGDVTLVYTGGPSGTFSPGVEDANRYFVLVGAYFSSDPLPNPATPTINGVAMTTIVIGNNSGADGGITGIYAIKIPTGTGTFTLAQPAQQLASIAIYRVTGISSMTTSTALSYGSSASSITGAKTSSANGCFFGVSVSNFSTPAYPTPNSTGLLVAIGSYERIAASNVTTGPTQTVSLTGNQINSYAIFGYDLY